ncbi:DUF3987 domain-containing protein [Marinilabilia salmonicolor]|uniref:DUF3987 domain-containing protein n=1 Tax=Marinilabilia salmonicolor TaxID=989 RepID=UPI000299EB91|nr:DUF3987 domain-containing protein [Marinilabilia salmonicolor]
MENKIFDVFPYDIQCFTMEAKEGLNLPVDFVLCSILYAASVAIGNTHQVKVKNGWYEGSSLFISIIGETGIAKSHAISLAINPLLKKNQEYYKSYTDELKEYQQNQLSKSKNDEEKELLERPRLKQLLLDDATMEAIYRSHQANIKGIGVYYDEILGWFNNMGKYNKGSDQEIWLKMWSRKPVIVNRVSSEPISLMAPHISVIGGIQTKLIGELFGGNRNKNGFIERMLLLKPDNLKKENFPENDMPMSALEKYSNIMNRLIELPMNMDKDNDINPTIVDLSVEALQAYKIFFNKNAAIVNDPDTCEKIKGFYPKIDTYTIRFALILQLLYWVCGEERKEKIGLRAMEGAITLSNFFINNAKSVIEYLREPESLTTEHRKMLALELYNKSNMSYREIGSTVGMSHEAVRQYVNANLIDN